jgi:hypothetical protein
MAIRIGFELCSMGVASVGLTCGFLATRGLDDKKHIKKLYRLAFAGTSGPALIGGFIETCKNGVELPTSGDKGTLPLTLGERLIGVKLESGAFGWGIPATLSLEIGPAGTSGELVYKKADLVVNVNNLGEGNVEFKARAKEFSLDKPVYDPTTGYVKTGEEMWDDIWDG